MKIQWVAVLMLVAVTGQGAGRDADVEAIRALGDQWLKAYETRDADAVAALFTKDAWVMPRGRPPLKGRDAIRASVAASSDRRKITLWIEEEELVVTGDWAWTIGAFTITLGSPEDDQPPVSSSGRAMLIYKREADGDWRIHRDMDTPAPDVALPASPGRGSR